MSYPKNLGQRLQYITNYSTNSVKLNPDNSAVELTNITSTGKIQFTLPPNSLIDLSSFSVYANFETTPAVRENGVAIRPHYLTRNVNSLIKRLTVEIGGQVINDIDDYNRIQQIFSDYQFGVEGSSKKILSNIDPLLKYRNNGFMVGAIRTLPDNINTEDLRFDKRPICMSQFLGFLGGGAGVKYIDTQLTGNIKITFELAPANHVLFRASHTPANGLAVAGGNALLGALTCTDALCTTQASYSLTNVFATIKKCQIDDGVYFQAVAAGLSAGIPFEYKFNHFQNTKSNDTTGNLTLRYEVMSNSVDMALLTFYDSDYNTVGDLPNIENLGGVSGDFYAEEYPATSALTAANVGKKNCYCSKYFKRFGNHIDNTRFYVNGERIPQYDMKNPQVYNQSLIDFGIADDVSSGIYYGINSYKSWEQNYWVATARLSHVCNDDSFISGYNANGVPLTLSVETTAIAANPAINPANYIAQLWIMTTEVMQVYSGRQLNRVK